MIGFFVVNSALVISAIKTLLTFLFSMLYCPLAFIFSPILSMRPGVDQLPQSDSQNDQPRRYPSGNSNYLLWVALACAGVFGGISLGKYVGETKVERAYRDGVDDMSGCVRAFNSRDLSKVNGRPANVDAIVDACRDRVRESRVSH